MPSGGLAPLPDVDAQLMPNTGDNGAFYNATSGYPNQLCGGVCGIGGGQFRGLAMAVRSPFSVGYTASIWTFDGATWTIVRTDAARASSGFGFLSGMLPFSTLWANDASPFGAYGQDELIVASTWGPRVAPYAEVTSEEVLAYDNNATTVFNMAVGRQGFAFPDQLRTLFVETTGSGIYNLFSWVNPVLTAWASPSNPDFGTEENIYQTNHPSAISALGIVTSGSLCVVTQDAGGYIVSGDVAGTPFVSMMPGVQSGGSLIGQSCLTPLGLVYASLDNGVWVWDGGAVAQKISVQLPDDFFMPTGFPGGGAQPVYPQGLWYSCYYDGNWLYVSNGWIYDMVQNSWWQIKAPDDYPFMYYAEFPGPDDTNIAGRSDFVYCFPGTFNSTDLNVAARMTKSRPARNWQWASNLIVIDDGYITEVQQVTLVVSGTGTWTTTITPIDGTGNSVTTESTINSPTAPTVIRIPMAAKATTMQVTIGAASSSSGYAPMVLYSIDLDWKSRYPVMAS
jgi:hypothetical protein